MNKTRINDRMRYLQELFGNIRSMRYAYLKYFYPRIEDIGARTDVDMVIDFKDLDEWKTLIQNHPSLLKSQCREFDHAAYFELYFQDGSYLDIDLIYKIRRKQVIFMDVEEVLDMAQMNVEQVKVANTVHSFEYLILFYGLNDAEVPEKYRSYFEQLPELAQEDILDHLQAKFPGVFPSAADLFDIGDRAEWVLSNLEQMPANKGLSALQNQWAWMRDSFSRTRPTITFSGVDGAGKSTILEMTKKLLEEKYRQEVTVLRLRPSILPILSSLKYGKKGAEARAASSLPRQGNNQNVLASWMRFGWYYLDYLIGQPLVKLRHNRRGRILLYDRYFYDFIVDPKRANLKINTRAVKGMFGWINKPRLNILLYADPEVILARKKELSADDIQHLTKGYLNLFETLEREHPNCIYLKINNRDLAKTMELIESTIVKEVF
ncbi:hypothetical protein [Pontibacter sp. G13]|uniref:hypothetical protein n=1 Tax=Pontibacter sp. G13 TaxID=3074898 RepID=UPI00288ACF0D|nr:hypothetical protein [Pontibacter sp. G13]WNJ19311.1 hypothetical protein RJD25_02365 [Pontibacter sp. G13]